MAEPAAKRPRAHTGTVTFGKYHGKPMAKMLGDAKYCMHWLLQNGFEEEHPVEAEAMMRIYGDDVREIRNHNRIQAKFTANWPLFRALFRKLYGEHEALAERDLPAITIEGAWRVLADHEDTMNKSRSTDSRTIAMEIVDENDEQHAFSVTPDESREEIDICYEKDHIDVTIKHYDRHIGGFSCVSNDRDTKTRMQCILSMSFRPKAHWLLEKDRIFIEIKPCIGDDFANILRQIEDYKVQIRKRREKALRMGHNSIRGRFNLQVYTDRMLWKFLLIAERFDARDITLEQFRFMCEKNGTILVFMHEIDPEAAK